uniref:Heat shock transcription factor 2 n=1 Tax=Oryzias sinensis TaxID=183150 RepID=A0A8C7YDU2_9TELE
MSLWSDRVFSSMLLCLCTDGFRKVMHMDTGVVKQERDGPVEFQHPYFKHGQDDLLENIKRKVSNTRPEDNKLRQEDLTKILATVQSVHSKQESIDARLTTLKRENESLWREISDLRQKHVHQQQLIKKLIHFIVTLVQSNRIINLKRKRPILMNGNGKKPKYFHEIFDDNVYVDQTPVNGLNGVKASEVSDDVVICDLTEGDTDGTAEITESPPHTLEPSEVEIVELDLDSCGVLPAEAEVSAASTEELRQTEVEEVEEVPDITAVTDTIQRSSSMDSNALLLNKPSGLSLEDPVKMMDSIMNENGAISQNINLLGKLELMDYLDSIDCSLEDFQAMIYEKQCSFDFEALEVIECGFLNMLLTFYKQLIQYTCCPLLAFLDGCAPPPDLDLNSNTPVGSDSCLQAPSSPGSVVELPSELLDPGEEPKQPSRSSLIRLEPLTEAEASEETLFYLCELSPAAPETDSAQLSQV